MTATGAMPAGAGEESLVRLLLRASAAPVGTARRFVSVPRREVTRLALLFGVVAVLALVDPETRDLAAAALANTFDDLSLLHGLAMLGAGVVILGIVILGSYLAMSGLVWLAGRGGASPLAFERARSVIAFGAWSSLVPTVFLKVVALAVLPAAMVRADPPSLFSAIEPIAGIPFLFAALLAAGFGSGLALATAVLVDGGFYLAIALLYLVMPSS